ncbi:unnamed protein product [Pylaiella littoralis]
MRRRDDGGAAAWKSSTSRALSKVCRKRWRTLPLAAGSPTPPMRINCANALLGGELYLFGGLNAGPSKSLWALNVRERRWRPIPAKRGQAPAPRHGHTMCWDGLSSLWVFGGQGAATSSADSSRTHQGVKIRTLVKRICFNDFFEFDTKKQEWRDHVQAGVCPTSRRGHTATFVRGRCAVDPQQKQAQGSSAEAAAAAATAASNSADPIDSSDTSSQTRAEAGGGNNNTSNNNNNSSSSISPRPSSRAMTPEHGPEGRSPMRGRGKRGGGGGDGGGRGGVVGEPYESREMFVIGGAGTDPIRNMEVVYPQLWIFNFDRSDWTCVEAAGGKGGGGAGGKTKGSQAASGTAGGSGNGGAAAGPGPPGVFDHTATLAGGKHIVVIGGIMVGRALNSEAREVYMLALDTLQWSTVNPHPLGFAPPSLHGHTAVEDPTHAGRLIVFGGRGGNNWNTQVLTFESNKQLWSMAVCDTDAAEEGNNYASAVPNNNDGNTNKSGDGGGSQLRVTIQEDSVIGRADPSDGGANETTKTMSATSNNNNSCTPQPELCQPLGASLPPAPPGILATSSKISSPGDTAAVIKPTTMPHQRHGHTCFVWDPRELALTKSSDNVAAGRNTVSRGAGGAPASPKRGQSKVGLSCV